MNDLYTRRYFLQHAAMGAAAVTFAPGLLTGGRTAPATDKRSKVILAAHNQLADESGGMYTEIARAVLEESLVALTNTVSIQDAWMQIFPHLHSSDTIGLKVNCTNRRLSSHPEVAYAITESLTAALGVNPNNLIIWDRTSRELRHANYTLNASKKGGRCVATYDGIGFDQSATIDIGNGKRVQLSAVLTDMCTYLINVPVLKDHQLAGVTLSLKNHYGSIDQPSRGHDSACDPYLANLNNAPQIREKTRLIVCDAALGIYHGGPGGAPQWLNRQLLVSTDPVALDTIGAGIIDHQRREKGLAPASNRATHLHTAASLGLGIHDEKRIDAISVEFG